MAEVLIAPLGECARWSLRLPASVPGELKDLYGFKLDLGINRCARVADQIAGRLGPDEWLLCAPPESVLNAEGILAGKHHSLVDVSHRYAGFAVEGPQAHVVLAAGCPLDLHPSAFAAGMATRTLLGKAEIVLWRLGDASSYRVECGRSFSPYVGMFLDEAAREWR